MPKKNKREIEFGDFQTPIELAHNICRVLSEHSIRPGSILEPTCGKGSFLIAAIDSFSDVEKVVGIDINPDYVDIAYKATQGIVDTSKVEIMEGDFFHIEWQQILESLPDPLLVIGNPPWVTNSSLGMIKSSNLPLKSNFSRYRGIEALMGKSNFDISEWMIIRLLECLKERSAVLAMLCKSSVARKVLAYAWKHNIALEDSDIYSIDALKYFGANVDACLLVIRTSPLSQSFTCKMHNSLSHSGDATVLGLRNGKLIANMESFEKLEHLEGEDHYKWRSGIKHDCSKVIEIRRLDGCWVNGFDESIDVETEFLYPMLKSSELASEKGVQSTRWMLVTQKFIGEDTSQIEEKAPKTWKYLQDYVSLLDGRASSIYKGRPRFSVFGVGDYSFTPWKVAISGLYKKLNFKLIGPRESKPVMFDDTCYFIGCESKQEAVLLTQLLNSSIAKEFLCSLIFWDDKRPITIDVLRRLNLMALAKELHLENQITQALKYQSDPRQFALF